MKSFNLTIATIIVTFIASIFLGGSAYGWQTSVSISGPTKMRRGDTITLAATGKPSGGTYTWSMTPGLFPSGSSATFTPTSAGTYTIRVTYKKGGEYKDSSDSHSVTAIGVEISGYNDREEVFPGQLITLTANGQPPDGTYRWSLPGTEGVDYEIVGGFLTSRTISFKFLTPGRNRVVDIIYAYAGLSCRSTRLEGGSWVNDAAKFDVIFQLDYIKVWAIPQNERSATVIAGQSQQFKAEGWNNGPDGISETADDLGPISVSADWSITGQDIGSVSPTSGSTTIFTAISKLPEGKKKLVGQVVVSFVRSDEEEIQGRARVTVIAYAKLSYIEAVDANDITRNSTKKLQMVSKKLLQARTAVITASKDNPDLAWAEDEPVWWGLISETGVDFVTFEGAKGGREHAQAGNVVRLVTIEIVPEDKGGFDFDAKEIKSLTGIITAISKEIGGGEIIIAPTGGIEWYNVDQTSSPLVLKSVEANLGGKVSLSQKFYIPALAINVKYFKIGAFVEPAVSLGLGVNMKKDGSKNPIEYTGSGNARLSGSVAAGLGAEAKIPKVIIVGVEGDAKVSASGMLIVIPEEQKLTGTYNIGKLELEGEVYWKWEWEEEPHTEGIDPFELWGGFDKSAEWDISSYFD